MKKLSSVLRSLLLIVLIGWLGVVQPAEAQQTVTLSGRVTDAAGQAVSGVFVVLERLPGYVWVDGRIRTGVAPIASRLNQEPTIFRFGLHTARSLPKA